VPETPPAAPVYPQTHIWSEATYAQSHDTRLEIANQLMASAEAAGTLSAGYLAVSAHGVTWSRPGRPLLYAPLTAVECSMTVRDPSGRGSGWAGASSYDWGRIDAEHLAAVALEKCLRSRNPVAVEPGRYTTILEPQATFELVKQLFRNDSMAPYMWLGAELADKPPLTPLPFHEARARAYTISQGRGPVVIHETKIGQQVLDPRISLRFDPLDPDLGMVPFAPDGNPWQPITWVKDGVLTDLCYNAGENVEWRNNLNPLGQPNPEGFRMDGGTTPIEEMIATTKRGILVSRFWGVKLIDVPSALCQGFTRDGLWLIENGKIAKAIKNLKFTESPLFALNQVDQIGVAVPVFSPYPAAPALAPPIKVRDFSFTALEDAI
jgi:predicted Zn-dependent protease